MWTKSLTALTFLLLSVASMSSQEWFPLGASWYYTQPLWPAPGEEYRYFEVVGDTMIQDKMCRIVTGQCTCGDEGYVGLLYVDGDRVYSYSPETEEFFLMYDFTLEAGDTLTLHSNWVDDTKYVISSISTYDAGGYEIRVQHLSLIDGWLEFGNRIYEYFGSNQCLYPQEGFCDPVTYGLRCYEDPFFGLISFLDPGFDCNYVISSVDDELVPQFRVYPNPASQMLSIDAPTGIERLECYALATGQKFVIRSLSDHQWDLSGLAPGIYLIRMLLDDGKVLTTVVSVIHAQN